MSIAGGGPRKFYSFDNLVPERVDNGIPRNWAISLNVIALSEGKEPEPISEEAAAVV